MAEIDLSKAKIGIAVIATMLASAVAYAFGFGQFHAQAQAVAEEVKQLEPRIAAVNERIAATERIAIANTEAIKAMRDLAEINERANDRTYGEMDRRLDRIESRQDAAPRR